MRVLHWVLNGKVPEPCADVLRWATRFEKTVRHVAQTDLEQGVWVSTVFLGIDHNFSEQGPPILFETMAFAEPEETEIFGKVRMMRPELHIGFNRYSTWDEALAGHERIVGEVKAWLEQVKEAASLTIEKTGSFGQPP